MLSFMFYLLICSCCQIDKLHHSKHQAQQLDHAAMSHELQSQQVHLEMSPNERAPSFKTRRQPHAAVADQSVWQVGQPAKHNSWPLPNVRNVGLPGHSPWIPSSHNLLVYSLVYVGDLDTHPDRLRSNEKTDFLCNSQGAPSMRGGSFKYIKFIINHIL